MDTQVINLFNDKNFVSYPYLQSKKVYQDIIGDNRAIEESNNIPKLIQENPFVIQNS